MLELINDLNAQFLEEMVQHYEEEFSSLTKKNKNKDGKYNLDTDWKAPNVGYYWKVDSIIAGFCVVDCDSGYLDIGEFYISPEYRKKGAGKAMAYAIFNRYQGNWQVRQIEGADLATAFWRNVIADYTNGNYTESRIDDPVWGTVTCQRFNN